MNCYKLSALALAALVIAGCANTNLSRQIVVSGRGTAAAAPDRFTFTVEIRETAPTAAQARQVVDQKTRQILTFLNETGVTGNNIKTSRLVISDATRWNPDTRINETYARQVTQSLRITVENLEAESSLPNRIIESLTQIAGIGVQSIAFDVKERDLLYSQARKEAYQRAETKAAELAGLSGLTLGRPIIISESGNQLAATRENKAASGLAAREAAPLPSAASGENLLPGGEIRVNYSIDIAFAAN